MNTRTKGNISENLALKYLVKKGYSLVSKNYTASKYSEIDLIMKDEDFIVFIEVKSILESNYFSIYETLTKKKKKNLKIGIQTWLSKMGKQNHLWRVDFIGLTKKGKIYKVEHFENIEI
jgi:putative endonuclease